jgi:hypothetical protein
MKKSVLFAALFVSLLPLAGSAGTIPLPAEDSVALVTIPDDWAPEDSEDGILAESPDGVTVIYFEVAGTTEELDALIEANLTWLMEDNAVEVDQDSMEEHEFVDGTRTWSRISWSGESKKNGPALIGFLFSPVGGGKILTVTYWIDKEKSDESLEVLGKIFSSVKSVE